jgi:hypothetical protein
MPGFLDFLTQPNTLDGMRSFNSLDTGVQAAGALTKGLSYYQYGTLQSQAAQFQSGQLRQQAGQVQAASQRTAWDADQSAKYIASDALAKAAASGGGASDPTVMSTIARIKAEGSYRQQLALYGGNQGARALNLQADAKDFEGTIQQQQSNNAGSASIMQVGSSLLRGYEKDSSLLTRFGLGGPKISSGGPQLAPDLANWGSP